MLQWEKMEKRMSKSYYINENEEFVIEEYNQKKPFASFLPAVSGLYGKPMWAYYVNRGQAMATFGVNNKDYSIMEFQPANKAYRQTALQGFRTFLKVKKADGKECFYEPFRDMSLDKAQKVTQKMMITSYDVSLEDVNETLGIKTTVMFCTLPEEKIPGLIRKVSIENIGSEPISVEVADGMAVIIPYFLINQDMKNESNLRQAWMNADLDEGLPFYRIKSLPYDTAETVLLEGGNFYLNFNFVEGEMKISKTIVDPSNIFGNVSDFTYPAKFLEEGFEVPKEQVSVGYTPCAFGCKTIALDPATSDVTYTLVGSAPSFNQYQEFIKSTITPDYMEDKILKNKELIERTKRHAFTSSNFKNLDLYMGQSFMDNYLRGGYPISVGNGKHVFYVYSRKHGDLEREYNFFQVDSTNYSQGNSNFRDVNQNRRNDVYFFPFIEDTDLKTFFNLIQLDGFNPLVLNGSKFEVENQEACETVLKKYFAGKDAQTLKPVLAKAFTPGALLMEIEQKELLLQEGTLDSFLNDLLEQCIKVDLATFQEGYWVDHWIYNIDLLEQFIQVYPDKVRTILFESCDYTFFDNDEIVVPRNRRYVLTEAGVRQYGALKKVPEKTDLMAKREYRPTQVRTGKGNGDIYYTTLAAKILILLMNKIASLDPEGIGVEMEGGKPGWCDALNGMPGIIGSSINESAEIQRLASIMLLWTAEEDEIKVPSEVKFFFDCIYRLLKENIEGMEYWEKSNNAKETYRDMITFGIDGKEEILSGHQVRSFFQMVQTRIEQGLKKAFDAEKGIYNTYFINEAVAYKLEKDKEGNQLYGAMNLPLVNVTEFKTRPIPPFLEGQVHMMRVNPSGSKQLHQALKNSEIYDKKLQMFKLNENVMEETKEIGRQNVFPRGWLENEAVFLHMEYKYFLELLRCGLYEEFYDYLKTSFIPALNPEVYGRSILENSSFIASSVHPNVSLHGTGYQSRLTGASTEMLHMWRLMTVGAKPFLLNEDGELCFKPDPKLPAWLFTEEDQVVEVVWEKETRTFAQPQNTFVATLFGSILTVYHNDQRVNTYDAEATMKSIELYQGNHLVQRIEGNIVAEPYARRIRSGEIDRMDIFF